MENILNTIIGRCVHLSEEERKRNNKILLGVIEKVINDLKQDKLFGTLYEKLFFGGSYYDGLKVGNPTEFDIDMLLVLPNKNKPTVKNSTKPGFVHVHLEDIQNLDDKYKGLEQLCDMNTNLISAKKVLSWFEGLLTKSFNRLCPNGFPLPEIKGVDKCYKIYVTLHKSGPAFNMRINADNTENQIKLDVDLVPCFKFSESCWPSKSHGYRQYSGLQHGPNNTFLAVPKLPNILEANYHWRLSFQEQERKMITGNELGRLKPALKLIKRLRDQWNHNIASYYIKTVFLWEVEKLNNNAFWNRKLCDVYLDMLRIYSDQLKSKVIPYYWNSKYNLICDMKEAPEIGNQIHRILGEIQRTSEVDEFVIGKHLVSAEELESLRNEVTVGKKKAKPITLSYATSPDQATSSSLSTTSPSTSSTKSTSPKTESSCEEILNKLKSDKKLKSIVEEMVDNRMNSLTTTSNMEKSASTKVVDVTSLILKNDILSQRVKVLEEELQLLKLQYTQLARKYEGSDLDLLIAPNGIIQSSRPCSHY